MCFLGINNFFVQPKSAKMHTTMVSAWGLFFWLSKISLGVDHKRYFIVFFIVNFPGLWMILVSLWNCNYQFLKSYIDLKKNKIKTLYLYN